MFEIQEKIAKIAVKRNPKTVIKGYKIEKITVQIFDLVCIKQILLAMCFGF